MLFFYAHEIRQNFVILRFRNPVNPSHRPLSTVQTSLSRVTSREFVDAARAIGASTWRVVFKHILPNALGPLITFSPFNVAGNISTLAALDYLGSACNPLRQVGEKCWAKCKSTSPSIGGSTSSQASSY